MKGLFGIIGKLIRSAGTSAVGTATVLGVAGAMTPGTEGGPQLQGATLEYPVFEVNKSSSLLGLQMDGGTTFFLIGGGVLILTVIAAFCCSVWGCQACRELSKRRAKQKGMKEEKLEQPENREIPKDRDLETAMSRLRCKMKERKGTTLPERGGERDVFADGLEF